jgi:hypothetical protein
VPHAGFRRLLGLAAGKPHGVRIFTSNVDGQFQKAGFAATPCAKSTAPSTICNASTTSGAGIWPADDSTAGRCRTLPLAEQRAALARIAAPGNGPTS